MNILILGATGFVGSAVAHLLLDEGFDVVCAGRNLSEIEQKFPKARSMVCDFETDTTLSVWLARLNDIDIIINCIGLFYHKKKEILWNIHFNTPKALYDAAVQKHVKQIIHISALNVDQYENDYANSKYAIEEYLHKLCIPYIIFRPSLIYGPGSRGGMILMRQLAAAPLIVPLAGKGQQLFQPIYVHDLAKAIRNVINSKPIHSITLAAVSLEPISLKKILITIRHWLGLKSALFLPVPMILIKIFARISEIFSSSIINLPAIRMLEQGNSTNSKEAMAFEEYTQVTPLNFEKGCNATQATKAEQWQPRLIFSRPLLRMSLALMWLWSAFVSVLSFSVDSSYNLLSQVGISPSFRPPALISAAIINGLIGLGLLFNYKIKLNCIFQIILISVYTLIISIFLTYLWLEPFGPIVKNIPIMVAVCILYILES